MCPDISAVSVISSLIIAVCLWIFHRHTASVFCLFLGLGSLVSIASAERDPVLSGRVGEYEAVVKSVKEEDGARLLTCDVDGVGRVSVRLYGTLPVVSEGNHIRFTAEIKPAKEPVMIVPDEIVITSGVKAEATVTGKDLVVTDASVTLRARIVDLILNSGVDDATGAMLCALLVGDASLLPSDVRGGYSAAGISHVLALSGLHVGVISMIIACALWPLYVGRHNRVRRLLTIVALWAYAALTGFSPSVTRAVVMASVYLFGRVIQRPGVPLNSLCFAALVILVVWPASLFSIGFQLSFAAVAGILLFYPLINRIDRRNHQWLYRLVGFPAVSLGAMAFTGVLSAFYFHSYPLFFLIGNLAISPFVPLLIAGGALLVLLEFAGIHAAWLCAMLDHVTSLCHGIADYVASLPGHAVEGLYFPWWLCGGILLSVALLAYAGWSRRLFPLLASAGVMVLSLLCGRIAEPVYPEREHFFLSDHNATNLLIRDGDSLMILTSATPIQLRAEILERAERRFRHYMGKRGLSSISLLPDTVFSPYVSRRGNFFSLDGKRYYIVDSNQFELPPADYLIITKGFTGDVVKLAAEASPSSGIILSSALNRRRLNRYVMELKTANINHMIY